MNRQLRSLTYDFARMTQRQLNMLFLPPDSNDAEYGGYDDEDDDVRPGPDIDGQDGNDDTAMDKGKYRFPA